MSQTLKQLSASQGDSEQVVVPIGAASHGELLQQLDTWVARGWLRALDRSLAKFILEQDPQAQASVLLAAAMTSHQLGRGHACLDLAATLAAPDFVLSLPPEGEQGNTLPSQWLQGLDAAQWRQALAASPMVEDRDASPNAPERPLVLVGQRLYLRRYWNYECSIAQALSVRLGVAPVTPDNLASRLDELFPPPSEAERAQGSNWQKIACALAARGNFSIITGGPGTGKTTSVVRLLGLLQTPAVDSGKPLRIRLAAPTGKAAARLSESIGKEVRALPVSDAVRAEIPTDVSTLHRLLGSRPNSRNFIHQRDKPLELDVLVVDEASMIDLEMMACVLDALPHAARLILLGDKDQLASVEAGSVMGDLCREAEKGGYNVQTAQWLSTHSGEALLDPELQMAAGAGDPLAQQTVMLRRSWRFDPQKGIGRLAKLINHKHADEARRVLEQPSEQLFNLQVRGEQDAALTDLAIDGNRNAPGYRHYLEQLRDLRPAPGTPWDSLLWADWAGKVLSAFDRFRLLCALRRGPWGVEGLNQRVATQLRRRGLLSSDHGWYEGRPVLVTRNDYSLNLMNGDIGIALCVPGPEGALALRVAFPRNDGSGGVRFVLPSRLVEVETVFAMTVHKSQGSEFNHTALVLPDALNPVLTKELLYTAITRAREWFSLAETQPGVFEGAVERNVQRASGLALQLHEALAQRA
ncbi:exodeoxyribonuclease V subunit alpha [Ectopseudomonas oleovorans]|uniref:RecBCD enzyme subunit RecD n=1 Tax=Ectopseudomonas oleovorans (strain CECT 5344) TaxID=1182590 RepID=W6R605_ECTO5|nr:exodeoxyribonuclease V subunit alpha [Pseudomonas oleovorans]MBP7544295.1 exodeoxyribonuclease V subunit alpha [Acidovorax sp.]CDM41766.1 exodeoxyribonuclease V alpha subunit [Pseudomonas oleovorans CECT 5344]CDR92392.1 exodeoxyribonuclease V alpha subunit [Pseudomonas oleovorans]